MSSDYSELVSCAVGGFMQQSSVGQRPTFASYHTIFHTFLTWPRHIGHLWSVRPISCLKILVHRQQVIAMLWLKASASHDRIQVRGVKVRSPNRQLQATSILTYALAVVKTHRLFFSFSSLLLSSTASICRHRSFLPIVIHRLVLQTSSTVLHCKSYNISHSRL